MRQTIPLFQVLLLELGSNCNRSCFFCPRQGDSSGKRIGLGGKKTIQSMPTHQAIRILDNAAELGFKGNVTFHHLSEPFLDPRTIDMAWEAKKRGMCPFVHTNGDMLRRNDKLCQQAAEVFDRMVIGLYDYQSEEELVEEKQFWQQKLQGTLVRFSDGKAVFPRTLVGYDPRMMREKKIYSQGSCLRPLKRLIVHYDGNVALCCEDMQDTFNLGNAFETRIEEIWFSEQHIRVIENLKQGIREEGSLCSICALPPTPISSLSKKGSKNWNQRRTTKIEDSTPKQERSRLYLPDVRKNLERSRSRLQQIQKDLVKNE